MSQMKTYSVTEKTVALAPELHKRSLWLLLIGLGATVAYWALPTWGVYATWSSDLPLLLKICFSAFLGLVGGYGILMTGFMGHDGTHFTLHKDKEVSSILGMIMTAPVPVYFLMGFTISHWNHHKYTNTHLDPDAVLFGRFKGPLTRLLIARPYSFYKYGVTALRLAFALPLNDGISFPLDKIAIQKLAQINLLINAVSASIHLLVFLYNPVLYGSFFFILMCGSMVSGLSPYIEHTGTEKGRGVDTRTSTGWWWDLFLLGNNYHLEHHLYPTIPFYRLKAVNQHLREQGYYKSKRFVSKGFFDTYRYVAKKYEYPQFIA